MTHAGARGILAVIRAAMKSAGISEDLLAKRLRQGLSARVVMVGKNGQVRRTRLADYSMRLQYRRTAVRLGGHEADKVTRVEAETYEERLLRLRGRS